VLEATRVGYMIIMLCVVGAICCGYRFMLQVLKSPTAVFRRDSRVLSNSVGFITDF